MILLWLTYDSMSSKFGDILWFFWFCTKFEALQFLFLFLFILSCKLSLNSYFNLWPNDTDSLLIPQMNDMNFVSGAFRPVIHLCAGQEWMHLWCLLGGESKERGATLELLCLSRWVVIRVPHHHSAGVWGAPVTEAAGPSKAPSLSSLFFNCSKHLIFLCKISYFCVCKILSPSVQFC